MWGRIYKRGWLFQATSPSRDSGTLKSPYEGGGQYLYRISARVQILSIVQPAQSVIVQ